MPEKSVDIQTVLNKVAQKMAALIIDQAIAEAHAEANSVAAPDESDS